MPEVTLRGRGIKPVGLEFSRAERVPTGARRISLIVDRFDWPASDDRHVLALEADAGDGFVTLASAVLVGGSSVGRDGLPATSSSIAVEFRSPTPGPFRARARFEAKLELDMALRLAWE